MLRRGSSAPLRVSVLSPRAGLRGLSAASPTTTPSAKGVLGIGTVPSRVPSYAHQRAQCERPPLRWSRRPQWRGDREEAACGCVDAAHVSVRPVARCERSAPSARLRLSKRKAPIVPEPQRTAGRVDTIRSGRCWLSAHATRLTHCSCAQRRGTPQQHHDQTGV